jgi:hypothetical protein
MTTNLPMPVLEGREVDIEVLRTSIEEHGFGYLPGAIHPLVLRKIQEEAVEKQAEAKPAEGVSGLHYRAQITSIGPVTQSFLRDEQVRQLLTSSFGGRFELTERRSCLTIYGEGDHLGPHLDKPSEECAVTIIVYVEATRSSERRAETGLVLRVFGCQIENPPTVRLEIPTTTGALVLGRGSKYWHERPKLQAGELVIAITGCYSELAAE